MEKFTLEELKQNHSHGWYDAIENIQTIFEENFNISPDYNDVKDFVERYNIRFYKDGKIVKYK